MIEMVIYFFLYGFLGYVCEVIYCSILNKKITNRGFLFGPICPVYGYCSIFIILFLYPIKNHIYLVIILGFMITSIIEYFSSYLLEKLFNHSLWDYSNKFLNINGRVCLLNSSLFTILVCLIVYIIHPQVELLYSQYYSSFYNLIYYSSLIFIILYLIDTIISCIITSNLLVKLQRAKEISESEYFGKTSIYFINRILKKYPKLRCIKTLQRYEIIRVNCIPQKKD